MAVNQANSSSADNFLNEPMPQQAASFNIDNIVDSRGKSFDEHELMMMNAEKFKSNQQAVEDDQMSQS